LVAVVDLVELGADVKNSNRNGRFLENGDAQNLQKFVETDLEAQPLPHDGDQHIDGECNPDLGLHGVLTRAIKRFDPQMLFDPLEQLNDILPIKTGLPK